MTHREGSATSFPKTGRVANNHGLPVTDMHCKLWAKCNSGSPSLKPPRSLGFWERRELLSQALKRDASPPGVAVSSFLEELLERVHLMNVL